MQRRTLLAAAFAIAAFASAPRLALAQGERTGTIYKNPDCTCCDAYADYLRAAGYRIDVIATPNLAAIKKRQSVPEALEGCHSLVIGKYVVEGHVPLKHIERLLKEKPGIKGISLPGMPPGSPGMDGAKVEPFTIYEIGAESKKVYAVD